MFILELLGQLGALAATIAAIGVLTVVAIFASEVYASADEDRRDRHRAALAARYPFTDPS